MHPETPLKLSSAAFGLIWTIWMVWWSGDFSPIHIGILAVCGALAGWLWFRGMRWYFRRIGLLPRG